jgi:hypothetical protein
MTAAIRAKAARLLTEGRVHLADVERAVVDGDTGRRLIERHGEAWQCSCPAFSFHHHCSHVAAVAQLTRPPPALWSAP